MRFRYMSIDIKVSCSFWQSEHDALETFIQNNLTTFMEVYNKKTKQVKLLIKILPKRLLLFRNTAKSSISSSLCLNKKK